MTNALKAVARGLAAGVVGTTAMTALQEVSLQLKKRATVSMPTDDHDDPWTHAPAPAQLLKRVVETATGAPVDPEAIPLYTNVMHWGYGISLGAAYGLVEQRLRARPTVAGPLFGLGVWAQSYATLVPLGLYEWPWHYSAKTIAKDLSYHLTYGTGVAAGFALLARRAAQQPAA